MKFLKLLNIRPISYYPIYREIAGSTSAGILLSQIMYWFGIKDIFYKTDNEIMSETKLSANELRSAKTKLKSLNFINIYKKGIPAKTYYEIDWNLFKETLEKVHKNQSSEIHETCMVKSTKQVKLNSQNMPSEIIEPFTITKNTTKTTTKKDENISAFRKKFISKNQGITFRTNGIGWLRDTEFTINEDGFILNTVSQKILDKDEALKIWKYLQENEK